jgi:ketosteroid isomerase-like protein
MSPLAAALHHLARLARAAREQVPLVALLAASAAVLLPPPCHAQAAAAARPAASRPVAAVRAVLDTGVILAPVRRFVDAFNRADAAPPTDAFTADAVITDDLPPFRWTGADALPRWWGVLFGDTEARRAELARRSRRMLLGPVRHLFVAGDEGYVAIPATITAVGQDGAPRTMGGEFSFTLRRERDGWRLTSHAWARQQLSH